MDRNPEETSVPEWIKSRERGSLPVIIRGRDYQEVLQSLLLSESDFKPGLKVLSVGEGLSNFIQTLHENSGITSIAIDPIYALGRVVASGDTEEIRNAIYQKFGAHVSLDYIPPKELTSEVRQLNTEQMAAGSTYNLPIRDQSVDLVLSNRLFEHIDIDRALPEFVRVMKTQGEIRMGGVFLHTKPKDNKLFSGEWVKGYRGGMFEYSSNKSFAEAMRFAAENHLRVYIILNGLPRRSELRDTRGIYNAGILIIRKDETIPSFSPLPDEKQDQKTQYPYLGKLYRVDTHKQGQGDAIWYKLEEQ